MPGAMRIREAQEGEQESRIVEGYALKFGVRSRLLCDWFDTYEEIMEPGSVTREFLDTQDFILSLYHDPHRVLARSNKGEGTLNYEVDEIGVKFWAEMPKTADGDEALELVKRGDLDGCSFIYTTNEDDLSMVRYEKVKEDGKEVLLRHVFGVTAIYDFTLTWRPAYQQTECNARERDAIEAEKREEEQKQEETKREAARVAEETKQRELYRRSLIRRVNNL